MEGVEYTDVEDQIGFGLDTLVTFALFEPYTEYFEEPDTFFGSGIDIGITDIWYLPMFVSNDDADITALIDEIAEFEDLLADVISNDFEYTIEHTYEKEVSFTLDVTLDYKNETDDWILDVNVDFSVEIDLEACVLKSYDAEMEMVFEMDDAKFELSDSMSMYEGFRLFGVDNSPIWVFLTSLISIAIVRINKKK
ncbi:MAG: hypothetical protein OEY49_13325, partial [Candidatus Heimdallarchaeota archaeon]|nr:hypothetical protein [Candidatus Heimdallarchaeota archaeon]